MAPRAHESEWVYSTALSKRLLTPLSEAIHRIPSVSHPTELLVFACGYAFNPALFLLWPALIHFLSQSPQRGPSSSPSSPSSGGASSVLLAATAAAPSSASDRWREEYAALNGMLYVASALVVLAATEAAKASFATTRPRPNNPGGGGGRGPRRRYGALVGSLKSRHSFPSGDCAQAANLCLFVWRYVPVHGMAIGGNGAPPLLGPLLFGAFLPGVAFARVFYRCHWVEDCIGGIALSWMLHRTVMPFIAKQMMIELAPWLSSKLGL